MEEIIKKRTDLLNFFLKEDKEYTKEEILQKEFAVLSFSPREEYIDLIKSDYDDLCVDLDTFTFEDTDECYVKGIIVDIDRQDEKTIIHLMNKDNNVGISIRPFVSRHYDKYLVTGEPCICKCKIWRERLFMSFLVNLNHLDDFQQEIAYMSNISFDTIKRKAQEEDKKYNYALVINCDQIETKNKKEMVMGVIWDGQQNRRFGIMVKDNNRVELQKMKAGSYIRFYKPTHEFFINYIEVVQL